MDLKNATAHSWLLYSFIILELVVENNGLGELKIQIRIYNVKSKLVDL